MVKMNKNNYDPKLKEGAAKGGREGGLLSCFMHKF